MRFLDNYPREVKVFLAASLINATGSALMWPLITMYVYGELGRSMQDAGLVILIQSLGGIAVQLLGGSLYHKVGVSRLIVGALAMNALVLFIGNSIWNTGVSPFIISEGLPKKYYGFLWTLNGILIFAAQPLVALIKRWFAAGSAAQMTASAVFYLSGYIVILTMPSYAGMLFAMLLTTLGEMLIAPAMPAFISEHASHGAPFYLGLTGGIGAVGRVLGPFFMGSLFDAGGLAPTAWLACGVAVLAVGFFVIHAYGSRRGALSGSAEAVKSA
ncbi:MFS transporter [Paenibacillus apii]|uniref:MFS transporter n=1 Tax=Paenibacillus apii TaxID=1850370 RepID=UPI0014395D75|nr:MFS transporter [Paenibacillus apii]NJJ39366.1 MFS transporter [Paenibacillus apii]